MRAMDGSGLRSILLAMSTPLSACPLACGKPGLEVLWVMPNLSVNALNDSESNWGHTPAPTPYPRSQGSRGQGLLLQGAQHMRLQSQAWGTRTARYILKIFVVLKLLKMIKNMDIS